MWMRCENSFLFLWDISGPHRQRPLKLLGLVCTDLFWMSEFVWSGTVTAKPRAVRCAWGDTGLPGCPMAVRCQRETSEAWLEQSSPFVVFTHLRKQFVAIISTCSWFMWLHVSNRDFILSVLSPTFPLTSASPSVWVTPWVCLSSACPSPVLYVVLRVCVCACTYICIHQNNRLQWLLFLQNSKSYFLCEKRQHLALN